MSQLDHIPPEQMPEVLSAATRLYEADREAKQEQKSAVDAAAELDIPAEYLERAAVQVRQQRAQAVIHRRHRSRILIGTAAAFAVIGGAWTVTHRPPPTPTVYSFSASSDQTWSVKASGNSDVQVQFVPSDRGVVADVQVKKLDGQPGYYANFNTYHVPSSLSGYRTMTFSAKGNGIGHVKVAFEHGNERWISTLLNVDSNWREYQLPLNELVYQTRTDAQSTEWRGNTPASPGTVGDISFKLGQHVNDPSTTGDLQIDRIVLK